MDERTTPMPTGGLAWIYVVLGASGTGFIWDWARWLNESTSGLTGPQVSLFLGLLGFTLSYGPKALRWAARPRARLEAERRGAMKLRLIHWIDWFEANVLGHRSYRLCQRVALSSWWGDHCCLKSGCVKAVEE